MIAVTVYSDKGMYTGFRMEGHAGKSEDPAEGQELVCAAVSALSINTINSIEHFTDTAFETEEDDGYLSFSFKGQIDKEAALLLNSLIFGLADIEESYGEPYIKIRIQEV